jgi:hypothetical protein
MSIEISPEERLMYLITMAGAGNRLLYEVYKNSDDGTRQEILESMAKHMQGIEPIMEAYGLERNAEGVARAMVLTEDLIGCEPKGELLSATPTEAIRKVTFCPWAESYSDDGGTCRLVMAAMEEGVGKKYGLEISCEQSLAEGADHCIWTVRKVGEG